MTADNSHEEAVQARRQDFQAVFLSSETGRSVFEAILKAGGLFSQPASEEISTAFHAGRRSVALFVLRNTVEDPIKKLLK